MMPRLNGALVRIAGGILIFAMACIPLGSDHKVSGGPFDQATIRYFTVGGSRWRQPMEVTFIVSLKGVDAGEVTVFPNAEDMIKVTLEGPAAVDWVEQLREDVDRLAGSLGGKSSDVQGCVFKIGVKLVGRDGNVVERVGCRSVQGWAVDAKELTQTIESIAFEKKVDTQK